ncbi:hypothetical protein B0T16DRAFT_198975 [Cercophora newfieldiana]|uniref:Uncharacterized protein n=1 Tax=Cercophora newfieldiana TaxID=92897 RepID=A0AA40CPK0_9PEZI|nr:hypothetical protein B0T16DRAFT_198975 [Cercophora newfieldiana]
MNRIVRVGKEVRDKFKVNDAIDNAEYDSQTNASDDGTGYLLSALESLNPSRVHAQISGPWRASTQDRARRREALARPGFAPAPADVVNVARR